MHCLLMVLLCGNDIVEVGMSKHSFPNRYFSFVHSIENDRPVFNGTTWNGSGD